MEFCIYLNYIFFKAKPLSGEFKTHALVLNEHVLDLSVDPCVSSETREHVLMPRLS